VVSWNILGRDQHHLDDVADRLRGTAPDVVALQEVRAGQAHDLARALGWQMVWRRKHSPYTLAMWWRSEGLALLSPHPLGRPVRRSISPGVSHMSYRHRIVIAADVTRDGRTLRVYDTHLSSDDATERIEQATRVADLIRSEDAPLRVVCGDLNTQTDEPEVLRELRGSGVRDHGVDPTNPANAPVRRLDYVLVPDSATDVDVAVPEPGEDWRELSDHLPVVATFTL
jgi:endonuclease/exonuclease/phosphatase family metal-dependent hydrolase